MTNPNVEIWRASAERFKALDGRDEWEGWIDRESRIWHPDIEWDLTGFRGPGLTEVLRGIDAVRSFWREWFEAWETLDFDFEMVGAEDYVVMLVAEQRMRGRASGVEVPLGPYAQLARFQDGLMVHWRAYGDQSAALRAAGLQK